jgi:NAD(P)-dependent dehydrogenase (short-subunit alcohol dehydrogenase family)
LNETRSRLDSILRDYGTISTLVLNSGSAKEGLIYEINEEEIIKSFENNFWAHQNICQEVFKEMKYQEIGGSIVFNITKQVLNQGKGFGAYGISKSAMLSLMRQYSIEGGPYGIRSNGVNPDKIKSNLLNDDLILKRSTSRSLSREDYMRGNLLNREVLPENVAEAIYFLSEAESTTGALLGVDGGNVSAFVR